ncbi:hypothetical protein Smp_198840 [Schistosoma mansoni]|uniref:hypothetical protein n=1 Tax=Schistosoma mansoni TaxID=6183 RepID=UPI00022C8271|nr:hypothetical protein Smp_198840 [Schistosoma mansoni]|eukprot:XP_018646381.1 hypothetical protein Smp_198840 [Schistosoma mansoni]
MLPLSMSQGGISQILKNYSCANKDDMLNYLVPCMLRMKHCGHQNGGEISEIVMNQVRRIKQNGRTMANYHPLFLFTCHSECPIIR